MAVAAGCGEPDSDGVGACLLGGAAEGAVLVAFEPLGKAFELEVGVIKSEYSELGGVELADKGGGGQGRAEEVVAATVLGGKSHQEEGEEDAEHHFIYN